MVSPAFPGMFFALAAAILLLFASVSPPAWERVSFLTTTAGSSTTVFGVFGECLKGGACSGKSVGYNLAVNGATSLQANSKVLHNLTYLLIIHPIAGGFCLFAALFGLLGVCAASRFATVMMAIMAFIGFFLALFIFVIDMVLWNILKDRVTGAGYTASLGNANWFTVGGAVSALLAVCLSCCGAFGRFASGRSAGEKY